jgi:exodeoxyribonuclease V alpha subunit
LLKSHATIHLCAPTGKAAKRMAEVTGLEANTIHRAINFFGKRVQLAGDFIIVDETSMIDIYLFDKLLQSISLETNVLFVGDENQLPSVGPGQIFRDLVHSDVIPATILTQIYRQQNQSSIIKNAHKIIQGLKSTDEDGIQFDHHFDGDFFLLGKNTSIEGIKQNLIESIHRMMEHHHYQLKEIQILFPAKQGQIGVHALNTLIQETFNPLMDGKQEFKLVDGSVLRQGDRVMQSVNNYDLQVFNGEVGEILSIKENQDGDKEIEVDFGDKKVIYNESDVDELILSYAMTVHKSQGSEFPVVLLPLHNIHSNLMHRNLIYTAITRAREKVVLIGDVRYFNQGIQNMITNRRNSRLIERLKQKVTSSIGDVQNLS